MKTITLELNDADAQAIAEALTFVQERDELLAGARLNDVATEELAGQMLAEVCRGWMDMLGLKPDIVCIGCGCDDNHACAGSCSWLMVDRATGRGVCSQCPEVLEAFQGELRVRALHDTIAEFV